MKPDIPNYAQAMQDIMLHFIEGTPSGELFQQRQKEIYRFHMKPRVPAELWGDEARLKQWLVANNYHYDIINCENPDWMCRRIRHGQTTVAIHFFKLE